MTIKPVDVLVAEPDAAGNVLRGEVLTATYLGPHTELLVRCGDAELRVPVARWMAVEAGDAIGLRLPPERVSVLRAGEQPSPDGSAA